MKSNLYKITIISSILLFILSSCKKKNEAADRLVQFALEINNAPDKELGNGTLLTGCEFNDGDSIFIYQIKVSDNRYDNIETDSIKRNFEKTVKSEGLTKIINLLDKANVGLRYNLTLPEKEINIDFPHSELVNIAH